MSSHVWKDELSGATLLEVNSPKHGVFIVWIDKENAERVSQHTWSVKMQDNCIYFQTKVRKPDGKWTTLKLHRFIKACPDGLDVDHEKHEYLDLRESELRCVNQQQNQMNRRKMASASSRFKGVNWNKRESKWKAHIKHNGRQIHLGYFHGPEGEIEAALAYNKAAVELFGEFAKLNFPLKEAA